MSRYRETDRLPDDACAGCKFWKIDEINEGRDPKEELEIRLNAGSCSTGQCRRHSPVTVQCTYFPQEMGREERNSIAFHGMWPETFADDWCGDFEKGLSPYAVPESEGE